MPTLNNADYLPIPSSLLLTCVIGRMIQSGIIRILLSFRSPTISLNKKNDRQQKYTKLRSILAYVHKTTSKSPPFSVLNAEAKETHAK